MRWLSNTPHLRATEGEDKLTNILREKLSPTFLKVEDVSGELLRYLLIACTCMKAADAGIGGGSINCTYYAEKLLMGHRLQIFKPCV